MSYDFQAVLVDGVSAPGTALDAGETRNRVASRYTTNGCNLVNTERGNRGQRVECAREYESSRFACRASSREDDATAELA